MREFKIFIDENFPPQLARGLHVLVQPQASRDGMKVEVLSIKDTFGEGAKDEDWIPEVGRMKGIVITKDMRIQSLKHQKELYVRHGVGMIFFHPPSKNGFAYWDLVKLVVERWEDIVQIAKKNKAPFAFKCTSRKGFERLDE